MYKEERDTTAVLGEPWGAATDGANNMYIQKRKSVVS